MPWTDKPGGGSNGKGPWGQQPTGGNGGDRRPDRRPQPAPDLEELLRSGRERFRRGGGGRSPRGGGDVELPSKKVLGIGAAVVAALWVASGFYQIAPGQRGVETTLGDYAGLTGPGLNWHVPWPFQSVEKVDTEELQSTAVPGRASEASMLTSDLNIVDVSATVNWKIKADAGLDDGEMPNAAKYIFNVEEQEEMIRAVTEAALREVIGANEFEQIVSRGRAVVQDATREIVQRTLDEYESGIDVVRLNFNEATPPDAVVPAQTDVINARSQAEQRVNEAQRYANQIVPRSRGEAEARVLQAEAYAAETVAEARGLASRFDDVYAEYVKAPEVTRQRLYLETMEDVLGDMNKVVIDNDAGGTLPYLNVNELARDAREGRETRSRDTRTRPSGTGQNLGQAQSQGRNQAQGQTGGQ